MLDTLLEIGRILRQSPEGLKHHRYVKAAPRPSKDNPVKFWTVIVESSGAFDFSKRQPLESETKQLGLFYLNYKTSDADSMKKYVFGDVYRTITKTGEDGNFRFGDPQSGAATFRLNSFLRGEADSKNFESPWLNTFRDSFLAQLAEIEAFLVEQKNVYIHFDCDGYDWHTRLEFATYNTQMLGNFGRQTPNGFVLDASLYKTIAVGGSSTAGFGHDGDKQFRNRVFATQDDLLDLVYAVDISTRSKIRKGDMKVIILPRVNREKRSEEEDITAEDLEIFFGLNNKSLDEAEHDEKVFVAQIQDEDELFEFIETPVARKIAQFDFIFSKASSSPGTPDADMLEISGLDRSKLSHIAVQVRKAREEVTEQRRNTLPNAKSHFSVTRSFLALLGTPKHKKKGEKSKANFENSFPSPSKKYQAHLFSVLPQIYTETYFRDPSLLPALIEKTEFYLREGESFFAFLRFDFLFLTKIQIEGENMHDRMLETQSYKIGYLLGKYSKQFSGSDSPVKSFEKGYAGLFSRRVTNIDDVRQFQNKVTEMLIMHRGEKRGNYKVFFPHEVQQDLTQSVNSFSEPFDRHACAYGFFAGYFEQYSPKEKEEADDIALV